MAKTKKTAKKKAAPRKDKKKQPAKNVIPSPSRGPEAPSSGASAPTPVDMTPMPTGGRKVTEFQAALDEQIAAHPEPQHGGSRPGAGRKVQPKAPPAPEVQRLDPADISSAVTELLRTPFDLWAAKAKLPELALTTDEAETVTKPVQVLLDFYVPNMRPIDWAWASLAITAVAIMRPRIILLQKIGPGPQGGQREAQATPAGSPASASPASQEPQDEYKAQNL